MPINQKLLINEAQFAIRSKESEINRLTDEIYYLKLWIFRHTRMQKIKGQRASTRSRMKNKYKSKLTAAMSGVREV